MRTDYIVKKSILLMLVADAFNLVHRLPDYFWSYIGGAVNVWVDNTPHVYGRWFLNKHYLIGWGLGPSTAYLCFICL